MRIAILSFLLACNTIYKPVETDGPDSYTPDSNVSDSSDTDSPSDTVPFSDTMDTSASDGCVVEPLGVVAYEDGTRIYDLATTATMVYVTRPEDGVRATGVIDGWHAERFDGLVEYGDEAPDAEIVSEGAGQYLGVTAWLDADAGRLCSQTYGEENAGRLLCWPEGDSGVAEEIAELDVTGENPSGFFGYGMDMDGSGVYAFEASPPNAMYAIDDDAKTALPFSACNGEWDFCQDGYVFGTGEIVTSSDFGFINMNDPETGGQLWYDETADAWTLTNLNRWGDSAVLYGSPLADAARMSRLYTVEGVYHLYSYFISGVTSGRDSGGKGYIAYNSWTNKDDGSTGSFHVFTERTGALRQAFSYPEMFGEMIGIEDPTTWQEPYILVEALDDSDLVAVAVRGGNYLGLVRICGDD